MIKKNFTFGKNWLFFIARYVNAQTVSEASRSLINFVGKENIQGKTFLDIGCGSGLFSLAALNLGADKVLSFDMDPDSILACKRLRRQKGSPKKWQVIRGSILDKQFTSKLGRYDLVYAWGVLHHTGKMWIALDKTLKLVAPKGYLYLAIYNKATDWKIYADGRFGTSSFWKKFKECYSRLPFWCQGLIEFWTILGLFSLYLAKFKNPLAEIKRHPNKHRGMSWRADIRDWLGGYPYEYASTQEVINFVKVRGFKLIKMKYNGGLMNNEYLFGRIK